MKEEKSLKEIEEELFESDDANEFPPDDVVTYNELKSCADLLRLYQDGTLELHPTYQRSEVWGAPEQTRFIDSLVKGMPIPSICLSLDFQTQKWEVIDGQQRIRTIIKFLDKDSDWTLSKINDISTDISGRHVDEIKEKLPNAYRRIQNASLPINILRCNYSEDTHVEYIFTIFSRLNTTSVKLSNQEIRNAMFNGNFNDLLHELEKNKNWQIISPTPKKDRQSSTEMVLRFFAFSNWKSKYDGKLSKFLSLYMKSMKNIETSQQEEYRNLFKDVVGIVSKHKEYLTSKAMIDAVMYGVFKNREYLKDLPESKVLKYFIKLRESEEFNELNIREGVAQKNKVIKRLDRAKLVFSGK